MRFEYSSGRGSCSLTHNLATGKAEHPGACDDEGPPPLPCCERSRWGQHETACPQRAIPHLFVVSIEPDDVDPGMVDVRALAYHLAHQGAEGTLQALCLPEGAIPQLGWYQLRALGEPVHAECQAALQAALQQHLDDLQRAEDSHAQVFGELRGVVTNLEAQLASERARNERLMDRLEQLQERFMDLGAASLATLESAPGPDGQPGATAPTPSTEDK